MTFHRSLMPKRRPNGDEQSELERQSGRVTQSRRGSRGGSGTFWVWVSREIHYMIKIMASKTTNKLENLPCHSGSRCCLHPTHILHTYHFWLPTPSTCQFPACRPSLAAGVALSAGSAGGLTVTGNNSPMTDKCQWINTQ